jgi:NodT family efflux transporter outer membrane factor (OMF) lipoprotein
MLAAGCAVGPNYAQPEPEMPDRWHEELARGLAEGQAPLQTWWTTLDDPVLDSLIERAVAGNLDLEQAVARVDEARARRGIARGQWFPTLDSLSSYSRQQISEEALPVPGVGGTARNFYSVGLDASWEIDLFGRIRRSTESANASLEATVEDYRDTLVLLLSEVGRAYVDVRTFQQRIDYAESNVRTQQGSLRLTRDRNAAGLVSDLDVRQAEQNLANTQAFIPSLRIGLTQAINRLGVLLGQHPTALRAELETPTPIPSPPSEVLVGLPTELLRQRPDLRSAERQLAAQTAQIGVAKADLYPRLALLGTFAFDALDAAKLFTGDASAFSFGPAVRWNFFDGGRIRSNVKAQESLTEQALLGYQQTVLLALEDVENAFIAYVQENDRRDYLQRSVTAAGEAVKLVNTLYRTGLTDFQNVLDTERSLFQRQDELAENEGEVTQNLVQIYRALGGGWSP